jgi:hypothetical protein
MILASVFFLLRSPFNFLAFTIPYAAYLMVLWERRILTESLTHNTIEGTILFLAALVISRQVYEHQVRLLSRTLLLKSANERLEHLSAHDPLTGLVNRSEMTSRIAAFTSTQAATGRHIGLILVDLDHFKKSMTPMVTLLATLSCSVSGKSWLIIVQGPVWRCAGAVKNSC